MQPNSGARARLIGLFLEGISLPQRFAEGLRLLADSLCFEQVSVRIWDRRGNWACVREARRTKIGWHLGTDESLTLNQEWYRLVSTMEPGRWQRYRVLHDRSHASASEPRRVDPPDTTLGLRFALKNGAEGLLVLRALANQTPKTEALPSSSSELVKALQSAMELTAELRQLNHRLACSSLLLDAIQLPLLLLDPSLRLLAANSQAQPIMERTTTGAGRRHIGLRGICGTKFSNAVRSACEASPRTSGSILRAGGETVRQIIVLPILMRHSGSAERAALILVQGQSEQTKPQGSVNQLLQQVYGLTPAEARLAPMILAGQSPGEAARCLKVSVATVRTQLSAILKKTGSRKQAELVRHLSLLMVLDQPPLVLQDHAS